MESGTARNVTLGVPTSFVNLEDDHNVVDPPTTVIGWASDNAHVLISDRWDIWKVPVAAGTAAVNLTVNGRKDQIRYQNRVRTDPRRAWHRPGASRSTSRRCLSGPSAPGYGVLEPGQAGHQDAALGGRDDHPPAESGEGGRVDLRPRNADAGAEPLRDRRVARNGRKFLDTSAEAAAVPVVVWRAVDRFRSNDKKEKLQASLYLPANYEKGKQYPMIVYIYERLTQGHNQYGRPTANGFSRQAYTSNGYAVLQPDIKYYVNDPGMSAVWALVPAVQAAIKTGVVDPKRVGLHGHSWGGYQTAITITQTDIFAAAIAGAPLTNMISMYSIIYKNTGGTNGAIFESSQGRFTGGPWEQWQAYTRNSPVAHAKNVKTPLIILHNDLDGAVDFTQGIEYYNTLRRLQKPVILLEYPGENHGLARPANQQDYTDPHEGVLRSLPEGRRRARLAAVRRPAPQDAGAHRPAPERAAGQREGDDAGCWHARWRRAR